MKQCMGCMEIYQDNVNICPYCGYVEGTLTENTLHIEPGAILNNRYVIGKVLGYGGFGVTYIAWDSLLEQKVAIKEFLPSEFATRMLGRMEITIFSGDKEKQFMEGLVKFVEEAKKLAKFNNVPGIIKIFDCIEENNTAYIIMELLEGETLGSRLENEKKMSADKAISMLLPIMESLRQVNAAGIIHRDIAPDNIFITRQGDIKLIDFGAARYATTSLSRSLTIIIKPGYSPEEQYRSLGDQGSWTDVYSIGATLYRMITGEVPCDSMERRAYLEQTNSDMLKPISKYSNKITKSQENAILNAMNIKVSERTPNMSRLIEELTAVTDIHRIDTKEVNGKAIDFPVWTKIVAVLVSIVCIVSAILVGRQNEHSGLEKGMTRVPNLINLTEEEAKTQLKSSNLAYKVIGYTYVANRMNNSVIYQSKNPGEKVAHNSEIEIKISKVRDTYEVANVLAMDKETAKELLEKEGYTVEIGEEKNHDVIEKDCIIKQQSDQGSSNKVVTLTVSIGSKKQVSNETVDTPNYVGKNFVKVLEQAKKDGVKIEVMERKASSNNDEGEILEQKVEGFINQPSKIRKGRVIQLVVSSGKSELVVSDYIKSNIDDVRDLLIPRGINIEEVPEQKAGVAHGEIFEQNPPSGTKLKTGDTVTLKFGIGSENFNMIDVSGKSQEDAERLLKRYGLKIYVKKGFKSDVENGCVISQSISPNTETKVGANIEIIVCDSSADIVLPEMIGKDMCNVEEELKKLDLKVKIEYEFNPTVKKDYIISTSPSKGETIKVGGEVKLLVSKGPGDIASVVDVVKQTLTNAKKKLSDQGLVGKEKYVFSTEEEGIVIEQSVKAGEQASTGDEVILTVSKGSEAQMELAGDVTLTVSESTSTFVTYSPTHYNIIWQIENEEVAEIDPDAHPTEVDTNGKRTWNVRVKGKKAGTTYIKAIITYVDNTTTVKKCKVVVQ